jgi:hypothetical protein
MHGCLSYSQLSRASDNVEDAYPLERLLPLHLKVDMRSFDL